MTDLTVFFPAGPTPMLAVGAEPQRLGGGERVVAKMTTYPLGGASRDGNTFGSRNQQTKIIHSDTERRIKEKKFGA